MDRYQRVEKPREEEKAKENEIRITVQGRIRNYITYAMGLLQEKDSEIVLKAMGRAINKTVMIAELIKRRVAGLHQNTLISSTDITETWEPLEEGLLPLETTRHVSTITITLSKNELDTSSSGYQRPIPADQVKSMQVFGLAARGRRRATRAQAGTRAIGVEKVMGDQNENDGHEAGGHDNGNQETGQGQGRGYRRDQDNMDEPTESSGINSAGAKAPPRRNGYTRGGGRARVARNHRPEAAPVLA